MTNLSKRVFNKNYHRDNKARLTLCDRDTQFNHFSRDARSTTCPHVRADNPAERDKAGLINQGGYETVAPDCSFSRRTTLLNVSVITMSSDLRAGALDL